MAITFYHVNWCPECLLVREKLEDLQVAYEDVVVPDARARRQQVYEVSKQYYVPVIKDDDVVLTETHEILAYLDEHYGTAGHSGDKGAARQNPSDAKPQQLDKDDQFPSCRRT